MALYYIPATRYTISWWDRTQREVVGERREPVGKSVGNIPVTIKYLVVENTVGKRSQEWLGIGTTIEREHRSRQVKVISHY